MSGTYIFFSYEPWFESDPGSYSAKLIMLFTLVAILGVQSCISFSS